MNPQNLEPQKTPTEEIAHAASTFNAMLENPKTRKMVLALIQNDTEQQKAFSDPKGVGIGQFSQFFNLPVSTVRHYISLGLIKPLTVNSKFRFVFHNIFELEHVRQWVYLGMKLEEIALKRKTGLLTVGYENGQVGMMQEITDPAMIQVIQEKFQQQGNPVLLSPQTAQALVAQLGLSPEPLRESILSDCNNMIEQLELKLKDIQSRLERAKTMREYLQKTQVECKLPSSN